MKKNKPLLSVVMPTYNRAGMVRHAIQSIVDQTFNEWELIIVDDGSTDDTENVIKAYTKKDIRIRYFKNKKNKGISYSRNFGNSKAEGKIIVVQDSDDMSLPDRLEEIWKVFSNNPKVQVLYHWFYIRAIDIRFGARAVHRELHRCGTYDRKRAIKEAYIPGQLAYKKEVAKLCPYRKEMISWDDWMFIIDCTMKALNFYQIERPLYEYVVSDDSITTWSEKTKERHQELLNVRKILETEYKIPTFDK